LAGKKLRGIAPAVKSWDAACGQAKPKTERPNKIKVFIFVSTGKWGTIRIDRVSISEGTHIGN
jgi:hypothetical protein